MRWSDIADGIWTVAETERDKGTIGKVRLPQIMLNTINVLPRFENNPFVFASPKGVAFNHWSEAMRELRAELPGEMPHFTLHDLRRTARTLEAIGVKQVIAERVLGHTIAGVEGVYNRHQYFESNRTPFKP